MSNFYDLEGLNQGYEGGVVALTCNELYALKSLNNRVRLDKIFTEEDGKLVNYLNQKYQVISDSVYQRKEKAFDELCMKSWQSHEDKKAWLKAALHKIDTMPSEEFLEAVKSSGLEFEVVVITECSMGIETREESRTVYQTRKEALAVQDEYKGYRRTYSVVSERIKGTGDE